jgi:hypothetical protein
VQASVGSGAGSGHPDVRSDDNGTHEHAAETDAAPDQGKDA